MSEANVIIGAGRTGLSAARFLAGRGEEFVLLDDRASDGKMIVEDFTVVPLDPARIKRADRVVLSPGVPLTHPALNNVQEDRVTNDVAMFGEHAKAPIVGITGSNGKSTVTRMVGELAARQHDRVGVCGNIGIPCLDLLANPHDLYVLELSSYQLEVATSLPLKVAAILNLSPDHLDRYNSVEDYYAAKGNILNRCQRAVMAREIVERYNPPSTTLVTSFTADEPRDETEYGLIADGDETYLARGTEKLLATTELSVVGQHNVVNALAALAIGEAVGLDREKMCRDIVLFEGLPHRCEKVADAAGVIWINDSKATNPGATRVAIQGLAKGRNVVLVLGGDAKGADLSVLNDVVSEHVSHTLLLGKDRDTIASNLPGDATLCDSMAQVVSQALRVTRQGDVVLMSPACASTDMFDNFEVRGDEFRRLVLEVTG